MSKSDTSWLCLLVIFKTEHTKKLSHTHKHTHSDTQTQTHATHSGVPTLPRAMSTMQWVAVGDCDPSSLQEHTHAHTHTHTHTRTNTRNHAHKHTDTDGLHQEYGFMVRDSDNTTYHQINKKLMTWFQVKLHEHLHITWYIQHISPFCWGKHKGAHMQTFLDDQNVCLKYCCERKKCNPAPRLL